MSPIEQRMQTLMMVIDDALMYLDSREDQLMLACAMMHRSKEIFDRTIGEKKRKEMFKELV